MEARPKVYLAGPDVFLPNAVEIGGRKKELCALYGFEGMFPFDNEIPPDHPQAPVLIYRANIDMMRGADCGIFNLTPFRGPSADVGTVYELGFLAGLGTPAFAYSNDAAPLVERVKAGDRGARFDAASSSWRDASSMAIEDHALGDNLMIDVGLAEQGNEVVRRHVDAGRRFTDLAAFELCLVAARRKLLADDVGGARRKAV